ncbi:MAG: hypothetical protein N3F09_07565, partial [Bacteroidia bacterium]|nr:hypothetical protein [Bacteroidia bacterium]
MKKFYLILIFISSFFYSQNAWEDAKNIKKFLADSNYHEALIILSNYSKSLVNKFFYEINDNDYSSSEFKNLFKNYTIKNYYKKLIKNEVENLKSIKVIIDFKDCLKNGNNMNDTISKKNVDQFIDSIWGKQCKLYDKIKFITNNNESKVNIKKNELKKINLIKNNELFLNELEKYPMEEVNIGDFKSRILENDIENKLNKAYLDDEFEKIIIITTSSKNNTPSNTNSITIIET